MLLAKSFEEVYKRYLPENMDTKEEVDSFSDDETFLSTDSDAVDQSPVKNNPDTTLPSKTINPTDKQQIEKPPNSSPSTEQVHQSEGISSIGYPPNPLFPTPHYPGMYSQFMMPPQTAQFDYPYNSTGVTPTKEVPASDTSSDMIGLTFSGITGIPPGFQVGGFDDNNNAGVKSTADTYNWNQNGSRDKYVADFIDDWDTSDVYNDTSWSRAVGNKQTMSNGQLEGSSNSRVSATTFQSYVDRSPRPSEEFVHQSQVENDAFQPYASIKESLLLPSSSAVSGSGGDDGGGEATMHGAIMAQDKRWWSVGGDDGGSSGSTRQQKKEKMSKNRTNDAKLASYFDEDTLVDEYDKKLNVKEEGFTSANEINGRVDKGESGRFTGIPASSGGHFDAAKSAQNVFPSAFPSTTDGPNFRNPVHSQKDNGSKVSDSSNDGLHSCLLCYNVFKTASELASHCSSDVSHLEVALLDSGADNVWKYSPPPPRKTERLFVCNRLVFFAMIL